jgi:S1-C subfamily serine protease
VVIGRVCTPPLMRSQEWAMSGTTAILATLLSSLTFTLAPVPPEVKPDPLGRGYMGVWFSNNSLSIDRVEPNMPGAKAGLRSGDLIVRVNSLHAESTQQVIDHVCSFRPGAIIEMEVQRGGERKVVKVKLATRPLESDPSRAIPNRPIIIDE